MNDSELFSYIEATGLSNGNAKSRIGSMSKKKFEQACQSIRDMLPTIDQSRTGGRYEFTASHSLSPGAYICQALKCRQTRANSVAKFASLYADKVYVPNMLDDIAHLESLDDQKQFLIDSISILQELQPAIDAGILAFAETPQFHLCPSCISKRIGEDYEKYKSKIDSLTEIIGNEVLQRVKFEKGTFNGQQYIKFSGDNDLLEHAYHWYFNKNAFPNIADIPDGYIDTEKAKSTMIFMHEVERIMIDVVTQDYYRSRHGTSYLTGRKFDRDAIGIFEDKENKNNNNNIYEHLSHALPILGKAPLKNLIELRKNEQDTFDIYRSALTKAINSSSTEKEAQDALMDLVRPEIAAIDAKVRAYKKTLRKSVALDIVVASGFLGIGTFTGLIGNAVGAVGSASTAGIAGAAIAAVGGFKFTRDLAQKISDLHGETPDVRAMPYYFLWKALRTD